MAADHTLTADLSYPLSFVTGIGIGNIPDAIEPTSLVVSPGIASFPVTADMGYEPSSWSYSKRPKSGILFPRGDK